MAVKKIVVTYYCVSGVPDKRSNGALVVERVSTSLIQR
jgi:hypothetical protein